MSFRLITASILSVLILGCSSTTRPDYPEITGIEMSRGSVQVKANAGKNSRSYQLEETSNLQNPEWKPVAAITTGTDKVTLTDRNAAATVKFYRIIQSQEAK